MTIFLKTFATIFTNANSDFIESTKKEIVVDEEVTLEI